MRVPDFLPAAFQAPTGWLYVLGVIPAEHDAARWMIEKGALRGLSLTHIDGTSVPLEVSLCHEPARPGEARCRQVCRTGPR